MARLGITYGWALGWLAIIGTATPTGMDAEAPHGEGRLEKKAVDPFGSALVQTFPVLGTLVQTHTGEHVILDAMSPDDARFSALLQDPTTGEARALDARLLELLRQIARHHVGARIELVSGYRSAKLNEMMRKKGHHVASHSEHSLGHAVDFRVVLPGETRGIDPRALEREVRALGWIGGVGIYTLESDWFVHCDVGPLRGWNG